MPQPQCDFHNKIYRRQYVQHFMPECKWQIYVEQVALLISDSEISKALRPLVLHISTIYIQA